ncbi:MAG TPA: PIN domain-containing protein [Lacunisphaera sp.]|nr:PIN domain-containing protein [Lacunisphaera sp.]
MKIWLVDTGPLIALLEEAEKDHAWVVEAVRSAPKPLLTCDAVLTEACFLLKRQHRDPNDLLIMAESGFFRVAFDFNREQAAIRSLLARYADLPMSFADACLVRMNELHPESEIWTLDRDFKIYRRNGRSSIPLISPF